MKLGQVSKYKVLRETNLGYMINDDTGDYFLHHNECCGRRLKDEEIVEAFLYVDKMKRVAATLMEPKVTTQKADFCEVVAEGSAGVFVNIGISRDILLSSDELEQGKWPQIGDMVCCKLKTRGKNLFINLLSKPEILNNNDQIPLEIGNKYPGFVYRITQHGINVVDEQYNIIFIYYKNLRKQYRIGEKVEVKILEKNQEDYTGTLIAQKEIVLDDDRNAILEYLNSHNGVMSFTSKTSPEVIYKVFKMSKAAFKRALGNLYKLGEIIIEEDKTILKNFTKNK